MLSATDISFTYAGHGRRSGSLRAAIRDVTVGIPRGRALGIIGPNGSGKTTLLRLLAGVLRPDRGLVSLEGKDLRTLTRTAIARRMAMVPQETHPAFEYTVLELVLMGRYAHLGPFEMEGPHDVQIARQALTATGTAALETRMFHTLSGGEKQRVVIASALAQAADLLLLDEPTSSLDLRYQLEVADLLRSLNRERSTTIVLSTHDLNFAASVCDSMLLIREGIVLAAGAPREVLTPARVRELYGIEADVQDHQRAGHLTVVPVRRAQDRLDR